MRIDASQERALKSREAAERQLHDLRAEVGKMKAQQAALKDTMKTSAARCVARIVRRRCVGGGLLVNVRDGMTTYVLGWQI